MATAAEFSKNIQKLFPEPLAVTPQEMQVFLEKLQVYTDTVRDKINARLVASAPLVPPGLLDMSMALTRWQSLLNYYKITTNKAVTEGIGPFDEGGRSLYYRRVVSPLIYGQCYFEPSCSEAVLAQQTPFFVAPRATDPFMIESGVIQNDAAVRANNEQFLKDVAEELKKKIDFAVNIATENVLEPLAYAAGAVLGLGLLIWFAGRAQAK